MIDGESAEFKFIPPTDDVGFFLNKSAELKLVSLSWFQSLIVRGGKIKSIGVSVCYRNFKKVIVNCEESGGGRRSIKPNLSHHRLRHNVCIDWFLLIKHARYLKI